MINRPTETHGAEALRDFVQRLDRDSALPSDSALAIKRNGQRLELLVEDSRPAIRCYESVGMRETGDRPYEVEGKGLVKLAERGRNEIGDIA